VSLSPIVYFQAEDGIRDRNVTGVQTCALPISTGDDGGVRTLQRELHHPVAGGDLIDRELAHRSLDQDPPRRDDAGDPLRRRHGEIGRASCREGVSLSVARVYSMRTQGAGGAGL